MFKSEYLKKVYVTEILHFMVILQDKLFLIKHLIYLCLILTLYMQKNDYRLIAETL